MRKEYAGNAIVETIYLGGGTPSTLSIEQLQRICDTIYATYSISATPEVTIECNPDDLTPEFLTQLRRLPFNRISMGVQSFNDTQLKRLGRRHNADKARQAVKNAREAGYDNISIDLMFALPGSTPTEWEHTIDEALSLQPEHISAYGLTIEEGTEFYKIRDKLNIADEDMQAYMYCLISDRLRNAGYQKYEISNFAHKGRESRHNLKYWRREEYMGFGPAAHSFFNGRRYSNSRDVEAYLGGLDIRTVEPVLSSREAMDEYVMLGMRLSGGIEKSEFKSLFGEDFDLIYGATFARFAPEYVYIDKNVCRFTDKGMLVSNYILSET
jgi:oxygen-independent coproporphyrinogen-3 oxidase